jgi:hypothetical protein
MSPGQFDTDEQTPIATGGATLGDKLVIKTQIVDPNPGKQNLRVRIEVKEPVENFDGETGIYKSDVVTFTTAGSPIEVAIPITQGLKYETEYKWRARVTNVDTGLSSQWEHYGAEPQETTVDVEVPAAPTPAPTYTPTPIPTLTPPFMPVPSPTGPTPPPLPRTNTPVPSATPVLPTISSVPIATNTQAPTHTPPPTPSSVPIETNQPPTKTPTPTKPSPLVNTGIPVTIAIVGEMYFILSLMAIHFLLREAD